MFRYYHYNLLTRSNNRYTYFISNLGCYKERQHSNHKLDERDLQKLFWVLNSRTGLTLSTIILLVFSKLTFSIARDRCTIIIMAFFKLNTYSNLLKTDIPPFLNSNFANFSNSETITRTIIQLGFSKSVNKIHVWTSKDESLDLDLAFKHARRFTHRLEDCLFLDRPSSDC